MEKIKQKTIALIAILVLLASLVIAVYVITVLYVLDYGLVLESYTPDRLQMLANLAEYINTKWGLPVAMIGTFLAILLAIVALALARKQTQLEGSMQHIDAAMFYNKALDEQTRIYSRFIAILHKLARTTYALQNRYTILACDVCAEELTGDVTEVQIQVFATDLKELSQKSRALAESDDQFTRLSNEYRSTINELIGFLNEVNEKHWEDYISHGIWEQLRSKTFFEIFLEKHEDLNIDRGSRPIKMELHILADYLSDKLKMSDILSNICDNTGITISYGDNQSETDRIESETDCIEIVAIAPELNENYEVAYLNASAHCIQKEFNFISCLNDAGKILSKDVYKLTFNMALYEYSDFNKNSDVILSLLSTILKAESEIKSYLTDTICKLYAINDKQQLEKRVNFRKIPVRLEDNSNFEKQLKIYPKKLEDSLQKLQAEREEQKDYI